MMTCRSPALTLADSDLTGEEEESMDPSRWAGRVNRPGSRMKGLREPPGRRRRCEEIIAVK